MNHLGELILVFFIFFFFHANAQEGPGSDTNTLHPFHPSKATIIGVLSMTFFLTLLILGYAKFCHSTRLDMFNSGTGLHGQNFPGLVRSRSRFSGIDRTVIESIPFFRFSSLKGSKEGLECAVCLCKFEETEILRLLPKCKHAFHMDCIDKWLESHSSCPLCRDKFDAVDIKSVTYSNSLRLSHNPSNLTEDPNLELFIQREQQDCHLGSSRFIFRSSFRKSGRGKKDDLLIQEGNSGGDVDRKILHKVKHKIIVSDVVVKNRWSDVNSSDLLFLNSEMLNVMSSKRFSSPNSSSVDRVHQGHLMNEQMMKIKEDMERKRVYECKVSGIHRSNSTSNSNSSFPSTSTYEGISLRLLDPAEKRSMSEITNVSRFTEFGTKNRIRGSPSPSAGNSGRDERIRRLWLPIAQRTVQWFANRERNSQQVDYKRHPLNV